MTGILYLDWPIIAVSLFNAILSLWLALTVLLSAERRNRGVFLTGAGLLASAAFFISHTAIVGWLFDPAGIGLDFWWHAGWLPVIAAPCGWYVLMLWYSGYWEQSAIPTADHGKDESQSQISNLKSQMANPLRRRHTFWLALMAGLLIVLVGLASFTVPSFAQAMYFDFSSIPTLRGIPVLLLVYPAFIVLCIGLSLDALLRPGPSQRVLGELARQRSRPWLVSASFALLIVSLLVTAAILWDIGAILRGQHIALTPEFIDLVAWFDLAAASLIGLAIVLMGQAVVSYEVFTGKTLPRRGFFRNWRGAVILAAGYGALAGGSIVAHLRPIYGLLLSAVLMTAFYALFNWRSFVERDQFMKSLRPFVGGQGLIDQLIGAGRDPQARAGAMFRALCADVLSAQRARLIPLGATASLVGEPLVYPPDGLPAVTVDDPAGLFASPQRSFVSLPPEMTPFRWAIPLWTGRGLIGALLLANKQDGGLYTQEEIEIARAGGEGIIDTLAGEEIARRLMALQRRRLAESQVLDRRARRMLHDEILPGLHTALLEISALPRDGPAVRQAIESLSGAHRQIANLIHDAALPPSDLSAGRPLPDALRRMLDTEFKDEFDSVTFEVSGQPPPLDPLIGEVLYYAAREAVRNAALHGRDPNRALNLVVSAEFGDALTLTIADDGVGLGRRPEPAGFEAGSRGGLALHSTLLAVAGGSLIAAPGEGGGTRVTLRLPLGAHAP